MNAATFYHVYNRANGSEKLFREERNYPFFLKKFSKYISPIANIHAYCLMSNHFHFLIRIKQEDALRKYFEQEGKLKKYKFPEQLDTMLSQQFSNLFNSYSKSYNKTYQRMGSLFIPNFKKKEVTTKSYLTNLVHYIHNNPIHHGVVKDLNHWPHNSCHNLLYQKQSLLKIEYLPGLYSSKEEFSAFHKAPIERKTMHEMEFQELLA